jgi:hypothetical protein
MLGVFLETFTEDWGRVIKRLGVDGRSPMAQAELSTVNFDGRVWG